MAEQEQIYTHIKTNQTIPLITKQRYARYKNTNKCFVLDCCREESKLPKYDGAKDKFLETFFQKIKKHRRKAHYINKKRNMDFSNRDDTLRSKSKDQFSIQQKRANQISLKLANKAPRYLSRLQNPITKEFLLPELCATDRSRQHLEHIIQTIKKKTCTQRQSTCMQEIENKSSMECISLAKHSFKPLSREEFLNTIHRYKTKL